MWIDKPEEKDTFGQQSDSLNSPSVGAGAGGGGAQVKTSETAANGTPSSMTPPTNAPTQQFGTIQDYFKGNQAQGEQLGEKVSSKLDETKNQEKSNIDTAATGAKNQIAANTIGLDQDLLNRAVTDPTKVANNENDYNKFTQQWNAAYQGPQSFEASNTYADAAKAGQAAKDKAAQLASTGGRQQLIQDEFGVYGQGNKGLDEALLQQSSYFPKVQEKAKDFGTIQDYLANQSKDINQAAQAAKTTTEQTKQQVQAPFTNKLTEFQTDLGNRVGDLKADSQIALNKYKTQLADASRAGADPSALLNSIKAEGASDAQMKTLQDYFKGLQAYKMGGDFNNFLTFNPNTDINPGNIATPADYDKAAALQKLTGVNYTGVLNPANRNDQSAANIPRSGRTVEDVQNAINAQIKNFGSADPGSLQELERLKRLGPNSQPTSAGKSPFDVSGLTNYLKSQTAPRDKDFLALDPQTAYAKANNITNVGAANNPQSFASDKAGATKAANALIDAANRTGDTAALVKFYDQIKQSWDKNVNWYNQNGIAFNPDAAHVNGHQAFLNTLGKVLGKPQV